MRRVPAAIGLAVVVVLAAAPALAGPQDVANDVASKVMSPFCDGVTLENCPSEEAVKLRATIEHKAAAGWSEARIMSWLRDQYGIEAAAPASSGVGLLAWVLPAVALAVGIALSVILLRRWTSRRRPSGPVTVTAGPGERARLERELADVRRRS